LKKFALITLLISFNVFAHGGDDGPSSFEDEFSKLSHVHLPMNYSFEHGLSAGFLSGHSEEVDEDHREGSPSGPDIDVHPVAFGGFDRVKRLINLEESSTSGGVLEESSEVSPYLLIENKKWDLGFGMEGDVHLPFPGITAGVGVSYLKGKNYYSFRHLSHKNERRAPLELPVGMSQMQSWRVGDQLVYASKGSFIFNVFVGVEPFVHIGPEYIHTGTFRVKAYLESENILEVEIVDTESDSLGIEGNGVVFNVEGTKGKGHLKSILYEFDLTQPSSFEAIRHLFNGRLDLTNNILLQSQGHILAKVEMDNTSLSVSGNFGIPFLYYNGRGKGEFTSVGVKDEGHDDHFHQMKIYTSALMKERFTRGKFSQHMWESESFISTIIEDYEGFDSVIAVSYRWALSRDHLKEKTLLKKLSKISDDLGLKDLSSIRLPQRKVGYLKTELVLDLKGEHILWLLKNDNLNLLKAQGILSMEEELKIKGAGLCRMQQTEHCRKHLVKALVKNWEKIKDLLPEIRREHAEGRSLLVTKKLNKVFKTLFSSPYLSRGFLKVAPSTDKRLNFEGESIKKHSFMFN
jgi:hypothetical protein